jgi:hypothetical protein
LNKAFNKIDRNQSKERRKNVNILEEAKMQREKDQKQGQHAYNSYVKR